MRGGEERRRGAEKKRGIEEDRRENALHTNSKISVKCASEREWLLLIAVCHMQRNSQSIVKQRN